MVGENIYEPLEANAKASFEKLEKDVPDNVLVFQRGKIEITPFARLLLAACFSNHKA